MFKTKHRARWLSVAATALAIAVLAPAAQAATPAPGFEQFTGCPTPAEAPTVELCIHSTIKSGHFQLGSKDVPIENPIPLTGGTDAEFENFAATSQGGLKQVKQKVPGGVIGLTGLTWLAEVLGSDALTLYAVTEAVGAPDIGTPEDLSLPIRVHLINPALGNGCYVGSPSNPIMLNLTTGTTNPPPPNKPITGAEPVAEFLPPAILALNGGKYVDNSFSAPGASGCTLNIGFIPISINGLVDQQSGLPAAAGTNETVQYIDTEAVEVGFVYP